MILCMKVYSMDCFFLILIGQVVYLELQEIGNRVLESGHKMVVVSSLMCHDAQESEGNLLWWHFFPQFFFIFLSLICSENEVM